MTPFEPHIPAACLPFLFVQKGGLDHLRQDPAAWNRAYRALLVAQYESLAPWLPPTCSALLDVGSGLGGIDILLARHYPTPPRVYLLDGLSDGPHVTRHAETFNDMGMAALLLGANDVGLSGVINPAYAADEFAAPWARAVPQFDLVVSFGAWCFHFPPAEYLPFVLAKLAPGGVLAVELRNEKPAWKAELDEALDFVAVVAEAPKFTRRIYRARA